METMAFHAVHPGVVLKEELEARGLTANSFALKLRVSPQRIQEIVAGKRAISPETALRIMICARQRRPMAQRLMRKSLRLDVDGTIGRSNDLRRSMSAPRCWRRGWPSDLSNFSFFEAERHLNTMEHRGNVWA